MIHAVFACANVFAVGLNVGIMIAGGKFDPLASGIIIACCGTLAGYELAKLRRLIPYP